MQLTKVQKNAVDQLIKKYRSGIKVLDFQAPTGSGKTFMISHFVANIFRQHFNHQKIVVLLATLSSSQLPKQFANKVNQYMDYLPDRYQVEHKMPPSKQAKLPKDYTPTFFPENKKLIIVGRSSFTQSSIFVKEGVFDQFLAQVKHENYHLVYIRDEAHHGGLIGDEKKLNIREKTFEKRIQTAANFVLRMTATFNSKKYKQSDHERVIIQLNDITDSDDQHLLKEERKDNLDLSTLPYQIDNLDLLKLAIKQFKKVKAKYKELFNKKLDINPAMLIQVDSETKNNKKNFQKEIKQIIDQLEANNLYWVKYFANDQKTSNLRQTPSLLDLSKNDSTVDVVIFKIGPATGWDIPRACMLVQLRNVDSSILSQQTIGRIMRNPVPGLQKTEITNKYYLYSNCSDTTDRVQHYRLHKDFADFNWIKGTAKVKQKNLLVSKQRYRQKVKNFFDDNADVFCYEIKELFVQKHLTYRPLNYQEKGITRAVGGNKISDAIKLKIFLFGQLHQHQRVLKPIRNLVDNFCQKHKINPSDKFWYLLIDSKINQLNDLLKKIQKSEPEPDYFIETTGSLPDSYQIFRSSANNKDVSFDTIKKTYAYYLDNVKNRRYEQSVDSEPEKIFMQKIISQIEMLGNKENWPKEFRVWAKNPNRVSQIYFEYFQEERKNKKLFLDFVFKIKKDNYVYVEVKSKNHDYDANKTKRIKKILSKYTKVSNSRQKVVFTIAEVNTKNGNIIYSNFSNIESIDGSPLSTMDVIQQLIS